MVLGICLASLDTEIHAVITYCGPLAVSPKPTESTEEAAAICRSSSMLT